MTPIVKDRDREPNRSIRRMTPRDTMSIIEADKEPHGRCDEQ